MPSKQEFSMKKLTKILSIFLFFTFANCYAEDNSCYSKKSLQELSSQELDNMLLNIFKEEHSYYCDTTKTEKRERIFHSNTAKAENRILELVEAGANPNQLFKEEFDSPKRPLIHAVERIYFTTYREKFDYPKPPRVSNTKKLEATKFLLEKGADPNLFFRTPALYYVEDNIELAKLLLEYGANPFIPLKDGSGCTPLHFAAMFDDYSPEVLELFLECLVKFPNADVDIRDNKGKTPFMTVGYCNKGMIKKRKRNLLLKYGADPKATSYNYKKKVKASKKIVSGKKIENKKFEETLLTILAAPFALLFLAIYLGR